MTKYYDYKVDELLSLLHDGVDVENVTIELENRGMNLKHRVIAWY